MISTIEIVSRRDLDSGHGTGSSKHGLMIITANGATSGVRICRYISLECTQSGDIEGQGCDEASRGFYGCEGGGEGTTIEMIWW